MEKIKFPDGFYLCRTKSQENGEKGAMCFSIEKFNQFLESQM